MMNEFLPCPICGGKDFEFGAFSISPDAYMMCSCGIELTIEVPWRKEETEREHDGRCHTELMTAWNRRTYC